MTEKLIDLVLQQFVGVDLIIAIVGLLIGWLLWLLIFGKNKYVEFGLLDSSA